MDSAQAQWEGMNQALQFGRLNVLRIDDVLATPRRDYILKGIMSPAEVSLWVGAPKCGKSFLLLYIAYAIAQGRTVFGRRVKPVPVLYVAAEGEAGIANRLRALRDQYGTAEHFFLIAQPADLLHEGGDGISLQMAAARVKAKLIVIDTLSRVMAGGDENGPADMGRFVANMGELRAETGAHVAIVHHGSKASNGISSRGHSSLVGAADAVIEVMKAEAGSRIATVAMAKDDPDGVVMGFRLAVVELGTDDDDDPIATCVVEEQDPPAQQSGPHLTQTEKTASRFLEDLIVAEGKPLPSSGDFPDGLCGVPEQRWREECESRRLSTADGKESRSRAFRRTYGTLKDKSVVAARDGWVWLTRPQSMPT